MILCVAIARRHDGHPIPTGTPIDATVTIANSQASLEQILPRLQQSQTLALDTEFRREDTYFPQLCLMQLATQSEVFLIDNLAIDDMSPVFSVLRDESRLKVLHAARQDLELLMHVCGSVLQPVFDTQIAAACLGGDLQLGYAPLVEQRTGVVISKSQTRTQWCARPLTQAQLDYAVEDVLYLHDLKDALESELGETERKHWFQQDCDELNDPLIYLQPTEFAWKRVKGAGHLDPDERRRLASVAAWRETTARREDRPRQWIVKDRDLIDIARVAAIDLDALNQLEHLPAGKVRRYGKSLIDAVGSLDIDPGNEVSRRPDEREKALVKKLKAHLQKRAEALGVKAELLAGRRELQDIAQGRHEELRVLSGWRLEALGAELLCLVQEEAQKKNRA